MKKILNNHLAPYKVPPEHNVPSPLVVVVEVVEIVKEMPSKKEWMVSGWEGQHVKGVCW